MRHLWVSREGLGVPPDELEELLDNVEEHLLSLLQKCINKKRQQASVVGFITAGLHSLPAPIISHKVREEQGPDNCDQTPPPHPPCLPKPPP